MNVLITGHKGFIGTVMVPLLQSYGHKVRGIDSDLYRNSTYGPAPLPVDEIVKDVRDIEIEDLRDIDAVVCLAALSNDVLGDLNPEITYEINHRAAVRLAEMAKGAGIQRYVFASSCSMYGASSGKEALDESAEFMPVTAYAKSKVLVERDVSQLASDSFSPTFMRNATAYGLSPRIRFDVVLNNLSAWAYTTGQVHMKSDGTPWRPVVHIEDISRAVAAVLAAPRGRVHNEAFNVGRNDENYQIKELAEIVAETIPGCELTFADGAGPDTRNYRVSFDKYERTFPDFPLRWRASRGATEIYLAYRRIGLNKDEYEGPRYKRIAQLKTLLASGQLDPSYRWRS
jgi:nucleoside-diphosphate-sugar epimerase